MERHPHQIGRFRIEQPAGTGAMGKVYRAIDPDTGERVALKVIHGANDLDLTRFAREARLLAALSHPGIVRYVEHGTTPAGEAYLAMEWLDGEDLRARLAREELSIDETIVLARRAASALAELHEHRLVHRDIKPANLFLVKNHVAEVKLIDFGLARRDDASIDITRTGLVVGTPTFMSPEQARGQRDVDARADVFSLGCVLFRCLTGRRPFEGSSVMAVLTKIVIEESPRVRALRPDVPAAIDELCARMMAKDPEDRPANGAAVLAALDVLPPPTSNASRRARVSAPPASGLSSEERRLSAVVLVGREAPAPSVDEGTLETGRPPPLLAAATPLAEVVASFKGELDHLLDGTRIVTLGGASMPTDRAAQAARCALALRAALPGVPIGVAMLRSAPAMDAAIDRAAALLERSARASAPVIAIDEVVAALLDPRFEVRAGEDGVDLVGMQENGGARTVLGKTTALVGREWEVSTIQTFFRECVEESTARAVLVTGPAGIGKSRLAHEIVRAIARAHPDAAVWRARGDVLHAGSPLWLLGSALRRAAGLHENEPLEERRRRVHAFVSGEVRAADAARVSTFAAELMGAPFSDAESPALRAARADARIMGEQLAEAFRDLLAAACAARPVLLVIEDLHWSDASSLRFLGDALGALERERFMVLGLARPEISLTAPRLWIDRGVQEIRLKPLPRRAAEKLARDVLGSTVDDETITHLVARAEGNAFYLEELIRAVGARRRGSAQLPDTILAMVEARLEALDPELRRVLRAASIFGDVFWTGGVSAVLGGVTPTCSWSSQLTAWEVLVRRPESRFTGEPELAFRHALLREAAYATIPPEERARGHLIAGEWLEQRGESDAMVLAHHFSLGGDAARAGRSLLRAAEQALRALDLDAAIARADEALALAPTDEDRLAARDLLAEVHAWRFDWQAARAHAEAVAASAPPGSTRWVRGTSFKQSAALLLGRQDELLEAMMALMSVEPAPDAAPALVQALSFCVFVLGLALQFGAAAGALHKLDALAAPIAADNAVARAFQHLAHVYIEAWVNGDAWAALSRAEAARAAFTEARDTRGDTFARVFGAMARARLGAREEAERELWAIGDAGGALVSIVRESFLLWTLVERGAYDEARRLLAEVPSDPLHADPTRRARARWLLGEIARRTGDAAHAEHEIAAALEGLAGSLHERPHALATLAAARLALGRTADALTASREAFDALNAHGGHTDGAAFVRLTYAEALDAAGDRPAAIAAITDARDRLLRLAARIPDEDARASFLDRVAEHTRTLALARAWDVAT
jgi:tetratricopeptide (TPR) repeat protein